MTTKPESKTAKDITKSCVTFKLNATLYTGNKTVEQLAQEIAKRHGGMSEAMRGQVSTMDRQERLSVQRVTLNARKYLKDNSLSWDDNGTRLVKATKYQEVLDELTSFQRQYKKKVKELCAKYDQLVKDARARVGDLFEAAEFPESSEEMSRMYSFEFTVGKLDDASSDIRIAGLTKDQAADLQERMKADHEASTHRVKAELVKRIEDVVKKMAATLSKPDAIFRDSLIGNVKELAEIAPSLNVTADPKVMAAIQAMAKLADMKPEELREDKKKRKEVVSKAESVKDALKQVDW